MGGHSGLNISEDRGNAVALVTRVLQAVVKARRDVRVISLSAGDKRNAIAREASAVLEVCHLVVSAVSQISKQAASKLQAGSHLVMWIVSHSIIG